MQLSNVVIQYVFNSKMDLNYKLINFEMGEVHVLLYSEKSLNLATN